MAKTNRSQPDMMKKGVMVIVVFTMLAAPGAVQAVKIADITQLQGQRENSLIGIGLVSGLPGTGDGGRFLPAIKPLAAMLEHFGNPVLSLDELKRAKNIALVEVSAVIGANGAREGEAIDVTVSSIGAAKSLKGGRLMKVPLAGPNKMDPTVYALAGGPITVDPDNPTSGVIKSGAVLEQDVIATSVRRNSFALVIDDAHAAWSTASAIAMTINEAVSVRGMDRQLARVLDPKTVRVSIPVSEQAAPANFIAWVQTMRLLMPEKKARVTINSRAGTGGTIVIDGNVTISPVTISYRGMTISTDAVVEKKRAQAEKNTGATVDIPEFVQLKMLIQALSELQVPIVDRIAIVRELSRSGNLQGQLIEDK